MSVINLLHISDSHIDAKGQEKISEIAKELCDDVLRVQKEKKIKINAICFSGDLINNGANAVEGEKQWALAQNILIEPLIETLELDKSDVLFAPGNHEVNIKKIKFALERGLDVNKLEDIDRLLESYDKSYIERLDYFYDFIKSYYKDVQINELGYTLTKDIYGTKIGFACVDSAWRSSGKGGIEKGKLYVGLKQIKDLYKKIEKSDLKVCIMHHPTSWLVDAESLQIEKELGKFDIVLNGHVHENDMNMLLRNNYSTVYSTAGKLYPLDYLDGRANDGYNGYSIISYDTQKKKIKIFVRTYFGRNRGCFDTGLNIIPNGEWECSIRSDDDFDVEYDLVAGIRKYLCETSEKFSFLKSYDKNFPDNIENIIVEPLLARHSGYIREKECEEKSEFISVEELLNEKNNQLIIGKKETGKTTILHNIGLKLLDGYNSYNIIPLFVDMNKLPKKTNRIFEASFLFASDNMPENNSITKVHFKELFENGRFNLLIDNFDIKNADHVLWLSDFMSIYPKIKCFVTVEEEFFRVLDVKQMPEVFYEYTTSYIQYLGRNQIRQLVSKWSGEENAQVDDLVKRIDGYCNSIKFAKTPFNISIFMVIWDCDRSYIPANEGTLMQTYLEIVLEKLSPKEARRDNYSFAIKENFLSEFAHYLYLKNSFVISQEEFLDFTLKYHKDKGYSLIDSKFDRVFFEKNIITYFDGQVAFSRTSFLEYFLAVYAVNNDDFLNEMLTDENISNFRNELCFYAGLKKDCPSLLDRLSDKIIETIINNVDIVDELNKIDILTEFKWDTNEMLKKIEENRPSIEDVDSLSDSTHEYKERKPTEIIKSGASDEASVDKFFSVLSTYAGVIKNAELLNNNIKIRHLEYYMYGMNLLYGFIIKMLEESELGTDFNELTQEEKDRLGVNTKEELHSKVLDVTKIVLPIAIQHLIIESVGTPKLTVAINELIKRKKDCPFEKFMLVFLKMDMGIRDFRDELSEYIKYEESNSVLKIVYIKLVYYYRARYFGYNVKIDDLLLKLITEVYMKLNPKLRDSMKHKQIKNSNIYKSNITSELKKKLDKEKLEII